MDYPGLPGLFDEPLRQRMRIMLDSLRHELLEQQGDDGHWTGQLSASALSTATAISSFAAVLDHDRALTADESARYRELIGSGMMFLRSQQNLDGGFGDTDRSHSNIATSYLVQAASTLVQRAECDGLSAEQSAKLQEYVSRSGGLDGLRRRYGTDKTFVVPILTNLAIAGLVSWEEVAALPFEAAVFPQPMYRFLRVPVVSYAIPALVAIGQARHFHGRRTWLPLRLLRRAAVPRTMRVLERMQPESGGYLEAAPLTSFVVMSLAATGRAHCAVARHGLRFLEDSVVHEASPAIELTLTDRLATENTPADGATPSNTTAGSWPIDTNLATWVTSLSIHALAADPQDDGAWARPELLDWLLRCQHQNRHPFTGAEPGGWGWTDLSGAVPDGDDTPGAILALAALSDHATLPQQHRIDRATHQGIRWLIRLQNRNGGWPTFCRGWGKLPFDRSSTDLTAHAMRALSGWRASRRIAAERNQSGGNSVRAVEFAVERGEQYLLSRQRSDGSWLPLWFGNQDNEDDENPIYGTARTLLASRFALSRGTVAAGRDFLVRQQNPDGGWGGGPSLTRWLDQQDGAAGSEAGDLAGSRTSSVEETALAIEALAETFLAVCGTSPNQERVSRDAGETESSAKEGFAGGNEAHAAAIIRGVRFLLQAVVDGRHRVAWPIGFYFAKLWYHEKLYPLIFTVAALGKCLRLQETLRERSAR